MPVNDPRFMTTRNTYQFYDPAAAAWIALEKAAGYTFSTTERTGTHEAFALLRSNNLLDNLYLLQLLCMGTSARNVIPAYNPLALSPAFGAGVTHNTKSITYGGTATGYLDTGFTPSTHGWTLSSMGFGYYLSTALAADVGLQGVTSSINGTVQTSSRLAGPGSFTDFGNGTNRISVASNGAKGLRDSLKVSSSTGYISRYDGTANTLATKTDMLDVNASVPTSPFAFGARRNGGSYDSAGIETHGLIWIGGNGMTTADRDILDVILYNLIDDFGAL